MTRYNRELDARAATHIDFDGSRALARPTQVLIGFVATVVLLVAGLALTASPAAAQDTDRIIQDLEDQGWYIESGADGTTSEFQSLANRADGRDDDWYFVSLAGPADPDYADLLRDEVRPTGNVLVYFIDADDFLNVQLASGSSESVEDQALRPFDGDWITPDEFMFDVVTEYEGLTATTSSGSTTTGSTSTGSGSTSPSSSGGVPGWVFIAVPVGLVGGGMWFSGRRKRNKDSAEDLENAQKIRAAIQSELDELANDVIVLNGAVDLSEDEAAIAHYREATATYTDISDEIPDLDELENANLKELSELGARVAHARWQMDAAEAMIGGDPVPEKPKVEPPPAPARPAPSASEPARVPPRIQQRQARPRTQYSRSRRSSGGGLLDILIAGAGMMGNSRSSRRRSSGGMFGGNSSGGMFGGGASNSNRNRTRTTNRPRSGGGVFGGGSRTSGSRSSGSRRTPGRRSTSRSRSRSSSRGSSSSRSRASSSRRSSSRRRRR